MRVAVLFDNFGPYHLARLKAAAQLCDLVAIEVAERSADYLWTRNSTDGGFTHVTLCRGDTSRAAGKSLVRARLRQLMTRFSPDVIFVPGWSSAASLVALELCLQLRIPVAIMSESTERDQLRSGWKEWAKRRLVSLCGAALVGGSLHAEYLVRLGMARERLFLGYDVVDNDYFQHGASQARVRTGELRSAYQLPERYFLAAARFIKKKNLLLLLQAYALYRNSELGTPVNGAAPWDLVVLGDGALRSVLQERSRLLGVEGHVHFPGFIQYRELPTYYGLAGAFVHASTSEPWGLVVNEAMASGLPVIVSEQCGCVPELVEEGGNGFRFFPWEASRLAELMGRVAGMTKTERLALGERSRQLIGSWTPRRFAAGLQAAAQKAIEVGPRRTNQWERVFVRFVSAWGPERRSLSRAVRQAEGPE